jgi:hypothetical protein
VLLAFAPPARAAAPVTVTTAAGTAVPRLVSGVQQSLADPSRVLVGDGCVAFGFCLAPTVLAVPGEIVTVTTEQPVDEPLARAGSVISAVRVATTATLTLSPGEAIPVAPDHHRDRNTQTRLVRRTYRMQLVGPPSPPLCGAQYARRFRPAVATVRAARLANAHRHLPAGSGGTVSGHRHGPQRRAQARPDHFGSIPPATTRDAARPGAACGPHLHRPRNVRHTGSSASRHEAAPSGAEPKCSLSDY